MMLSISCDLTFRHVFSRVIYSILALNWVFSCLSVSFSFLIAWFCCRDVLMLSSSFFKDCISFTCSFKRLSKSSFFLFNSYDSFLWWLASSRQILSDCYSLFEDLLVFWPGATFYLFLILATIWGEWLRLLDFWWFGRFLGVMLFMESLIL